MPIDEEARLVPSEHAARQYFGIEPGKIRADACPNEAIAGALNEILNGHEMAVASFNFSDWKWVTTFSSISERLPLRISSSR